MSRAPSDSQTDRRSAFLAALQDGFLALSLDGTVEDVNQRFCEIVGLPREALVGSGPPFAWVTAKDEAKIRALVKKAVS